MKNFVQYGVVPIDYAILESEFAEYNSPRHKIAREEKNRQLLRLKRGLYVVSPILTGKLLSTELIANHIYGPSYISMETALRYYGLIPESVFTIKSMSTKRSRAFENSIGLFDYTFCPENYFSIGINQIEKEDYTFLTATPEKAICDLIAYTPKLLPRFLGAMEQFLEEDLRLDMDAFYKLDSTIFNECAAVCKKKNEINNIIKLLER